MGTVAARPAATSTVATQSNRVTPRVSRQAMIGQRDVATTFGLDAATSFEGGMLVTAAAVRRADSWRDLHP
jgi:hypothetical protein